MFHDLPEVIDKFSFIKEYLNKIKEIYIKLKSRDIIIDKIVIIA